jgi:hypothetical protein
MDFPSDTSSLLSLQSAQLLMIAEAQSVEKQTDTFLRAREIIRCANALKPFPHRDARVLHHNEARKNILFIYLCC